MLRIIRTIVAVIFMFTIFMPSALGAENSGTGLGLNKDITFTLSSSSIENRDINVPLDVTIQLDFNKNICNVAVLSNNKNCFHLTDSSGKPVEISVIFPDDQVQSDYKRGVFIKPTSPLAPSEKYRLAVDRTLVAKNGATIDNAHVIEFTTGNHTTEEVNETLFVLDANVVTYVTALPETEDSVPVKIKTEKPAEEDEEPNYSMILGIVLFVILVASTAFLVMRSKKKTAK